ncbi:hypothetical protein E5K00_14415 [Hymenobacter aquaticus]|uniref:T9SS type A sorting domain-containing protein n=1 Tax=Hymenobacter aquaticus TaxID=1867101 RepID=A0A4Z0PW28_9BACT|nr:hypothetical protein [Hymenobacter aquaticus]TGE21476.1 hypothetical protein E5K00_14415 [Hymenobacter aquaticus]
MKTRYFLLLLAALGLGTAPATAQYQFKNQPDATSAGLGAYVQSFNSLANTKANFNSNTTLPGVYARFTLASFGASEFESYQRLSTPAKLAPDDGSEGNATASTVDADGTPHGAAWYHFGTSGSLDRALGGIASTNITAGVGYIGIRLRNSSSVPIKNLEIKYAMEQWYNSSNTQEATMRVHYRRSTTPITQLTTGTWTPVGELDVPAPSTSTAITPRDGNAATNRRVVQAKLLGGSGVVLAPGEEIMVRWSYVFNSASNGNGLSIDDVVITPETNIFYSEATGDLTDKNRWGINTDGSGTKPHNFAVDNTTFYVRGTDSLANRISSSWAITGTNSKLVVGTASERAVLYLDNAASLTATVDVTSGSRLRIAKTQNTLTLGTLNLQSVVEYLNSSTATTQRVNGGSYGILKLNGTGPKTLAGPVLVTSDLAFTSPGLSTLTLADHDLTILKNGRVRTLAGTAFFVTNGKGGLRQTVSSTGEEVTFPVATTATAADYTPIVLSQTAASSEDTYKVRVAGNVYRNYDANEVGTGVVTEGVVKKTWFVSEEVPGNSDITLQAFWDPKDEGTGFDDANAFVDHYTTGLSWDRVKQTPGAVPAANKKAAKRGGVKNFSPFAVASRTGGVLPVTLTAFTAQRSAATVACAWATATETNSAYFVVERSANAATYAEIGRVAGAGTSTRPHSYAFIDQQPLTGTTYYRLRQVDTDGSTAFSPVAVVQGGAASADFAITPNPGAGRYELRTNFREATQLRGRVVNLLGQSVLELNEPVAAGEARLPLLLTGQPAGLYLVQLATAAGPVVLRVVKE